MTRVAVRPGKITAPCYTRRMTETLTIRLPKSLAREFRAKTRVNFEFVN